MDQYLTKNQKGKKEQCQTQNNLEEEEEEQKKQKEEEKQQSEGNSTEEQRTIKKILKIQCQHCSYRAENPSVQFCCKSCQEIPNNHDEECKKLAFNIVNND